jgi:hypothetical protein
VHKSCLTNGDDVIGAWTTASLRQGRLLNGKPPSGHQSTEKAGGAWVQVSRLGMPLVNEVVIGLKDKDKFNGSKPSGDGQFADYVTHPTLPALLEIALALPNTAPTNFPRTDLVTTFLTGIKGVNQPKNVVASEMLRLNTAIPPVSFAQQNRLGIVGNILVGGNDNAFTPTAAARRTTWSTSRWLPSWVACAWLTARLMCSGLAQTASLRLCPWAPQASACMTRSTRRSCPCCPGFRT